MIKPSSIAKLAVALLLLVGCATEVAHAQDVSARAWVLTDAKSGEYLAGENASARLPMASTTKIMLALVALQEVGLNREVTVSWEAASLAKPPYSNVGLAAGDVLSVRALLEATMISSGDDAAYALAEHLGGGSVDDLLDKMNREAEAFGLEDTHFENPVGFDASGQYSSARDLAQMTHLAMGYPEFRELVSTTYATISTRDRKIPLTTTNDLLFTYLPATGVKTGTTPEAGQLRSAKETPEVPLGLCRTGSQGGSQRFTSSCYSRTMVTGQWACRTTESDTLPMSALLILPCPLLPITINPAPISWARVTISSSALPSLRCLSLTVPPESSILLTC